MADGLNVVANEELFDRWLQLAANVQSMAGIVQNDVEIPGDQVVDWVGLVTSNMAEMSTLFAATLNHLGFYDRSKIGPEVDDDSGGF